jgi:hypothetical protein
MMHLYEVMAGKPMPEPVRAEAAETARREQRVILLLKPYATFETPRAMSIQRKMPSA